MKQALALLLLCALLLPAAAEEIAGPAATTGRVVITSGRFMYYRDKNYVEYIDNVRMVDGARVLTCARLLAYIDPQTKKMNRAEAIGSVVMTEGTRRALAGRANYYRTEEKVILTENPVLHQVDNVVSGDVITFFLTSENVVVEGNVRAELYPEQLSDTRPAAPAAAR